MAKRENSSGSIVRRKRASGIIYEAFAPAQYSCDADGRTICTRELLGRFQRRTEAWKAIEDYICHPGAKSKYNSTLRDLYDQWSVFAFKGISKQTQDNYTAAWAKFSGCPFPSIADQYVRDITTGELRALLDYYQEEHTAIDPATGGRITIKPLSRSYITKIKALLTQLYNYAMENDIVDKNYAALIKLARQPAASKKRSFSDAEFAALEQAWASVPGGDAVYALCYLGFRVSEFCELTPESYDTEKQVLVGGMKTDAGRNRIVPIHKNIQPIIDNWLERGYGTLCADEAGKPYGKTKNHRNQGF